MAGIFGLDFGTTNSVASFINPHRGAHRPILLTNRDDGRPHPSVVWYSAEGPVVGRKARDRMSELGLGVFGDVIRSPKMYLGSPSPICVGGTTRTAVDVVSEILSFILQDAKDRKLGHDFTHAVVTIPVSMRGTARRELREAAHKAGLRIHQFVHEPLAALYGYLRNSSDYAEEMSRLEGRLALVFDWGGGTLDLTLCKFIRGALVQVLNFGHPEVGGDLFDLRVRALIRERHQRKYPMVDWSRLQPTADARLLKACEDAKIALSVREKTTIYVREVLATEGPARDVEVEISRADMRHSVDDLLRQGLNTIPGLLEAVGIPVGALEFCLATGGMVAMPAIQEGLVEILGVSRLRTVSNSATIISEGAAWIAHDELRLTLAKPLELLHADNCYVQIMPARTTLPTEGDQIEQKMSLYCVDPRDGKAKFQFSRPKWPDRESSVDARLPYINIAIPVDPFAQPLFERLEVSVSIDHDLIAGVHAQSTLSNQSQKAEIHDLEFGLSLEKPFSEGKHGLPHAQELIADKPEDVVHARAHKPGDIRVRSNLAPTSHAWHLLPGEIVNSANMYMLPHQLTPRQKDEKMYYVRCHDCKRTIYEIERDGCDKCADKGHAMSTTQAKERWERMKSVFAPI